MPLTISCNANRMADLHAPRKKAGGTFIPHALTAMTSSTFTVSNAINLDWVRAHGLTTGAGTKTNCDSEFNSTSGGASLLGAVEKRDSALVNQTPCRLQWDAWRNNTTALKQQFGLGLIFTLLGQNCEPPVVTKSCTGWDHCSSMRTLTTMNGHVHHWANDAQISFEFVQKM